jgi:hypothetical protein
VIRPVLILIRATLVSLGVAPFFPLSAIAVQGIKVPIEGSEFYRLRYSDELISVNERCPVRKTRLGERMPPVLVNGRAIGFC